jgi:cobalt/nickel transport protein
MMSVQSNTAGGVGEDTRFFDGFTRMMLAVMFVILLAIFASGKYMSAHELKGSGTDDIVNDLAATTAQGQHHPFIELPGDAELGAFSVANFFAGLIVGYQWLKLFGAKPQKGAEGKED